MAVLLSTLKNKAATAVASQVSSFAKFGSSGGASALQGLSQGGNFSSTTSKNLTYPINVEEDPQQGHYIIFYVYQIDDAKLQKKGAAVSKLASGDADVAATNAALKNSDSSPMASQAGKGAGKSLSIKRPPMKKMDQAIALYMPPSVKVQYTTLYTEQDIGAFAQGAADVYNMLSSGQSLGQAAAAGGGTLVAGLTAAAIKKAGNMVSGARAMAQIASGLAISNKIELQFEGVKRRDFSYTFTFIPKSEQEAQIVEEIVFAFKKNMMPKYVDKMNVGRAFNMKLDAKFNGKIMQVPNIFDIEYHHKGKRNPFLNRVSSSYLTSVDVEYGSDRYKTYEPTSTNDRKGYEGGGDGPPPQKTTISLQFREIEMMSQERIEAGF